MKKFGALLATIGLLATLTACISTQSATDSCIARPSVLDLPDGSQPKFAAGSVVTPDGSGIDARGARWAMDNTYPVAITQNGPQERRNLCMVGGDISSLFPHQSTPWSIWHSSAGMTIKVPDFQALQTDIHNVGDGVRFTFDATNWTMRGVRITRAHDDCIENDKMNNGIVDDSLFDGCYAFYSARGAANSGIDGGVNALTLTNSLVRLEHMPAVDDGHPAGGHGSFFKMSANPAYGRSPKLVIRNTIFRADEHPATGGLGIPKYDHDSNRDTPSVSYLDPADCSNNTMVWLGTGPYPDPLPECFTITTDRSVWDSAVASWESRRP